MRKSKFTESQIIKAIKANENAQRVEDLCSAEFANRIHGWPYWDIIQLIRFGSSFRFTFDLFSRMSTRKSPDA